MTLFNCFKRTVNILCLPRCSEQFKLRNFSIQIGANLDLDRNETTKRPTWDQNWDKAAPAEGHSLPSATRHIFLVRHGQYQIMQKIDSQRELTEIGELQSNMTGTYLKDLGHNYADITSSDMSRCVGTANIISNSLPAKTPRIRSGLLRECHMIAPDPVNPDFSKRIARHHPFTKLPMVEAGFRKIFYRAPPKQREDSYHIIVGHLNVFCYFIARKNISLDSRVLRYITLINHGEFKDGKLTDKGLNQALKVAERLNYLDQALTSIVHSGSPRTYQTAEIIRESLTVEVPSSECPLLRAVEKVTLDSVSSTPIPPFLFYQNESLVEAAFRKHFYRPDPDHCTAMELFVCHPNIINYFICRSLQLSPQAWARFHPPSGSMTVLSIDGYSIFLESFGDAGHLSSDSTTNTS